MNKLLEALRLFEDAHAALSAAELKDKEIFCICGRSFPEGRVSRIAYGIVQYADNRCGQCD